MKNLHITEDEKKLLKKMLPEEEIHDQYFTIFHPFRTIESDELRAKNSFYNGMMMQLYLQNANKVKEISKDETVILLQQEVKELQEKLKEEKRVSQETIQKFKDDADERMTTLEKKQNQNYIDFEREMNRKMKLNVAWIAGGSIATLVALAELVYIVTKL